MFGQSIRQRERLICRQACAQLRGMAYSPPLVVRELPKMGRVHRVACWRFGQRQFHLAADTEYATFLHEYFREGVMDIRERVPAELDRTVLIAARMGLKHPGGYGNPRVLLTDLVVTVDVEGRLADEAVKVRRSVSDPGPDTEIELAILSQYWEERGVRLFIVLSHGLNSVWARNLAWLYPAREYIERVGVSEAERHAQRIVLAELARSCHMSAGDACSAATRERGLVPGASMRAFRQLLATGQLLTNLRAPALWDQSPSSFVAVPRETAA
ncbi:heteromeric transposase endonuclease subunit TnsA [Paraburkholderia phenazinium]|jgi:hypothetical protein|uniref:TnsA endonuclease C terminal n=1 Tax=Paraburkholderia phenazinium TaxID=60549 RepID=A0A1N6JN79_9BURK|nr:heteromeric transposase endonuclease subunit TnsA [Paraburkholderia phenazinium]SIO45750.1 TnsA endonuclease C terminal [Paraburkholderia phenazinium]